MSFRKSSYTSHEHFDGKHRFEHWYRDNTVYFITSRCRDKFPAFETGKAKAIFWDRFEHYTKAYGFVPWVTSLLNNHRYTMLQSVRHRLCADYRDFPDTHVRIDVDRGVSRAIELRAFLYGVPYKRYQSGK